MQSTRRKFVLGCGSIATIGAAGCIESVSPTEEGSASQAENQSDTDTDDVSVSIEQLSIGDGRCASDEDEITNINFEELTSEEYEVEFSGRMLTSDPCQVLDVEPEVVTDNDETKVEFHVVSESTDSDACQSCEGVIAYSGVAMITGGVVEDVELEHIN